MLALVVAMGSFPLGATLAKSIFPEVGAAGATVLRLSLAALMLCLGMRAWRARLSPLAWRQVARYGAVLGLMNLCFYLSLTRLPLGIAVALEFTGPLSVALWHARRALDFVWVALAVAGLSLLLPLRASAAALDPLGAAFALAAAMFWALYIIWGREAVLAAGRWTVALGSLVGALVVLPFGAAAALPALRAPTVLAVGLVVALLSSAVPYSLEMWALTRLPARVFGVSMSLEPALAALAGWVFLAEQLAPPQYLAIAAIIVACGGATLTARAA
ncbi:MAG: EamA family transporter [Steroidobacteraceae bacterium]